MNIWGNFKVKLFMKIFEIGQTRILHGPNFAASSYEGDIGWILPNEESLANGYFLSSTDLQYVMLDGRIIVIKVLDIGAISVAPGSAMMFYIFQILFSHL